MLENKKTNARGFTLIELLVVIAIIGILSAVVLTSLNSARTKARDARRISDIKEIQLALELSYDTNNAYPAALSTATLVTPGYMPSVPLDPTDNSAYGYAQLSSGSSYVLAALLEQGNNSVVANDNDTLTNSFTLRGAAHTCNETAPAGGEVMYCVTP